MSSKWWFFQISGASFSVSFLQLICYPTKSWGEQSLWDFLKEFHSTGRCRYMVYFCFLQLFSAANALFFFINQMYYAIKGTTTFDYGYRNVAGYKAFEVGTVSQRLGYLFGTHWYLNFACPQPWFPSRISPDFQPNFEKHLGKTKKKQLWFLIFW